MLGGVVFFFHMMVLAGCLAGGCGAFGAVLVGGGAGFGWLLALG